MKYFAVLASLALASQAIAAPLNCSISYLPEGKSPANQDDFIKSIETAFEVNPDATDAQNFSFADDLFVVDVSVVPASSNAISPLFPRVILNAVTAETARASVGVSSLSGANVLVALFDKSFIALKNTTRVAAVMLICLPQPPQ